MKDPKKLNIPNICFSISKDDDTREKTFKKQRIERGFDDSETWSLRDTIGKFIIPRLKRFRDLTYTTPHGISEKDWLIMIDKMIRSFELLTRDNGLFLLSKDEEKEFNVGMNIYNNHFMSLWL